MCVKILTNTAEVSYDMQKPLEDQLKGSKKIVINYEPKDPSIDHFLNQMERLCKNGISAKVNIQFNHNNHLRGAKLQKEMTMAAGNLDMNEVVKLMALIQSTTDRCLEEMSNLCFKR